MQDDREPPLRVGICGCAYYFFRPEGIRTVPSIFFCCTKPGHHPSLTRIGRGELEDVVHAMSSALVAAVVARREEKRRKEQRKDGMRREGDGYDYDRGNAGNDNDADDCAGGDDGNGDNRDGNDGGADDDCGINNDHDNSEILFSQWTLRRDD